MMSRSLTRVLLCSTLLLAPATASAAVDDAGAAKLKAMLQSNMDSQMASVKMSEVQVVTTGDIKVEPKGTYYAVTMPHLAVTGKDAKDSKVDKIDIGSVTMNVMPGATDKQWKIAMAIPSPIRIIGKDGKDEVQIKVGNQRINAIVDENFSLPLMMDMQLSNLALSSANEGVAFTLGDVILKSNYSEDAPGIWSGPSSMAIKNLSISAKGPKIKDPGTISIASITANSDVKGMDMNMAKQYQAKMAELGEAGFSPDNMSAESMAAVWKIIMDYGINQADAAKADLTIEGLSVDMVSGAEAGKPAEPIKFAINRLGYSANAANMKGDKAIGGFGLVMDGLMPAAVPADFIKYIPKTVNLTFGFKDLPTREILAQLGSLASQGIAAEDPAKRDAAKMAAMSSMMTMPSIMAKAGTVFSVANTRVANDMYDLNLNGEFKMQDGAMYGGVGGLKAVFGGMDALVTELQTAAQKPGADPAFVQQATQAAQGLTMMQMFGQQGVDISGKPARIYDLSVDATGAAKLNGTDLSAMMGGGAPGGPAPAGAPPAQAPAK